MSITGVILLLFLLFHLSMNVAAVFSADAYNSICSFLGANWYAVAGTVVLVGIIGIHFIYSIMVTLQNRKARGKDRYEVDRRPKGVSWASQNMFILGLVIIGFMALHLSQFWYKMMFAELMGYHEVTLCGGSILHPQDGAAFIHYYFSRPWVVVVYLIWYAGLWFHLTHGVWSAFQSIGWSNETWLKRLKVTAYTVATLLFSGFAFVTLFFFLSGGRGN